MPFPFQHIFPTQGSNSCLPLSGRFFTAEPPGKHIFPNQGLNLGLPHCRSILHQTEPPGKPKNTGVGSMSLLQGIFPTQGLNWSLLHCRQILYQLSHQGSPRILESVAYPFSSGSSQPRNRTRVSCITGRFFTLNYQGSSLPAGPSPNSSLSRYLPRLLGHFSGAFHHTEKNLGERKRSLFKTPGFSEG